MKVNQMIKTAFPLLAAALLAACATKSNVKADGTTDPRGRAPHFRTMTTCVAIAELSHRSHA